MCAKYQINDCMGRLFLKFYILLLLLLTIVPQGSAENDGSRYAANSVLSKNSWYKIKVSENGVYKLTYADLKKMGISNPANVKIYGYGGWMLDEDFSKPYVDDLPEVSLWMSKDRNSFGEGDYILFYARGTVKWTYSASNQEFVQTQNPYSTESFYFVTESAEGPALMDRKASLQAGTTSATTYSDYALHEKELTNLGQTGRVFYGENFGSKNSQDFKFKLDGATTDPALIRYDFVSKEPITSGVLTLSLNGTLLKTSNSGTTTDYNTVGISINGVANTSQLQSDNTINLTYQKGMNSNTSRINLNYILINYKRKLKPYGAVTLFRNTTNVNNLNYQIQETNSSMLVFDVTDNYKVSKVDTRLSGSTLSFSADNTTLREYALVDLSKDIPKPTVVGKLDKNQNLHALQGADMIIIVQPALQSYAEKLAKLHLDDSGLKSLIVNPTDLYNEFSSGTPDITAYRRFVKMFYDRATISGEGKPKYLLLFGDGCYDNRLIDSRWTQEQRDAMLLTYQASESLLEGASYVTDDYMGFLDDKEGATLANNVLDIGVGRIPVTSATDADAVVEKIKNYMLDANRGVWQNNVTFIADDLIGGSSSTADNTFIKDAETFSKYIETNYPDFTVSKIYEDAYQRVIEGNGARYPDATKALLEKINNGTLALNFIGHGATRSWTHEYVLNYDDILNMNNVKLPLWITATCDFSRFDANDRSGGEAALLNPNGGAIALFSTDRVVLINNNTIMNDCITKHILEKDNGQPARLGDILKNAKAETALAKDSLNKLKFILLGDPALRLSYPGDAYHAEVIEMNGLDASAGNINVRALDSVTVVGRIVNQNGEFVTDFNGIIESTIFDALQDLRTKGNTAGGNTDDSRATDYSAYTNTLFSGKVEVKDGMFKINFIAPKDILYSNNKGKMTFLAFDDQGVRKAQGSFANYTVGGTNSNAPEENNPPVISVLYLNEDSFKNGDAVGQMAKFYAKVSDDSGINLSSGIGHNISLIIDGKTEYDLTPYFVNIGNSSKEGEVEYRLPELSLGNHKLTFRVWDVWNNSTTETVDFVITNDFNTPVYSFEIWGNPAKEFTRFAFNTETPSTDVTVKLAVYSLTGKMVWNNEDSGSADTLGQYIYTWDLMSNGGRVAPGVYICTGIVTVNGKASSIKTRKLMVLSY